MHKTANCIPNNLSYIHLLWSCKTATTPWFHWANEWRHMRYGGLTDIFCTQGIKWKACLYIKYYVVLSPQKWSCVAISLGVTAWEENLGVQWWGQAISYWFQWDRVFFFEISAVVPDGLFLGPAAVLIKVLSNNDLTHAGAWNIATYTVSSPSLPPNHFWCSLLLEQY